MKDQFSEKGLNISALEHVMKIILGSYDMLVSIYSKSILS